MAVLQDININVHGQPSEKRLQTFLRLSQNENGRMINFRVLGPPLPSGCTATFSGTKPDGNVYSKTGTVAGNFVIIQEDMQMTAVAGVWDAKLDIINGSHNIMTALIRVVIDADVVDPDAIASDSQLQGLVAEAKYYAEHARTDAYGSPLTASTKSAMTDKTRVYVYTGSESGMTAGNWYYWNGSAWTSGGVYNAVAVQTDTTLSVAGKAADGKATGDAIDALKEDLIALEQKGYPMASIQVAVNEWANAHDAEIVNAYTTPEAFGAKGNGIDDDTVAIESALKSGKAVVFSGEKTYRITNSISITDTDVHVIGNGATIVFDALVSGNTYTVFNITNSNVYFTNLILDGNKESNEGAKTNALFLTSCVTILDGIIIKDFTKRCINVLEGRGQFSSITMLNMYNSSGDTNSFVYTFDSDTEWTNIIVKNDEYDATNTAQGFYHGGGNINITNIKAYNVTVVLDARNGSAILTNGYFYKTRYFLAQTSDPYEGADILISNVVCDSMMYSASIRALIYCTALKSFTLKNVIIRIGDVETVEFPVRVYYSNRPLGNITFNDVVFVGDNIITNFPSIDYTTDSTTLTFRNVTFPVLKTGLYALNTYHTNAAKVVYDNVTFGKMPTNMRGYSAQYPDNIYPYFVYKGAWKNRGATADRPTLSPFNCEIFYDTDLGKPIMWDGDKWVNVDGSLLT